MRLVLLALMAVLSIKGSAQIIDIGPQLKPAIVRLHDTATGSFFCSGTVISEQLILSAAHCMGDHEMGITVKDMYGKATESRVFSVRANERSDQALIIGSFPGFEQMQVVTDPAYILRLLHRDELEICGFPYAGFLFCEAVKYKGIDIFSFITDGAAWPGMSGGPVIDKSTGYIVGIISAMSPEGIVLSPTVNIFFNLGVVEVE